MLRSRLVNTVARVERQCGREPARDSTFGRLKAASGVIRSARMRDVRSAKRLMRWRFGSRPLPLQVTGVTRWAGTTVWRTIPTAQEWVTVSPWVSRTPYWVRDGNPLGGHPWVENPQAQLPATADVVVVGAGFGGACLAYHWASRASGSLVVLEKDDPASGAAGRNGGFCAPAGWYPGSYVYHSLERRFAESVPTWRRRRG